MTKPARFEVATSSDKSKATEMHDGKGSGLG